MPERSDDEFDRVAAGWGLTVDDASEELHLEHIESAATYVLDADGTLTVPNGEPVDGDVAALQESLAAALADGEDSDHAEDGAIAEDVETSDGVAQTSATESQTACNVGCDPQTGEVVIESPTAITLDAPRIDLNADGNANLNATGTLALTGSLITLN